MTSDKENYHHGGVPKALMDAALARIKNDGVEKLSLRAIARDIGVSQTAPYRHFKDKQQLLIELACAGFLQLKQQMAIVVQGNDVFDDLLNIGLAYINFAENNPEQYNLMFGSKIEERCQQDGLMDSSSGTFSVLLNQTEIGVRSGVFLNEEPEILAKCCWSNVHGLASLSIDGFFNDVIAVSYTHLTLPTIYSV